MCEVFSTSQNYRGSIKASPSLLPDMPPTCILPSGGGGGGGDSTQLSYSQSSRITVLYIHMYGGIDCIGQFFAYVVNFVFLRDFWIRTQRTAEANTGALTT